MHCDLERKEIGMDGFKDCLRKKVEAWPLQVFRLLGAKLARHVELGMEEERPTSLSDLNDLHTI